MLTEPADHPDEESGGPPHSPSSTFASDTELQSRKSSRASSLRQKLASSPSALRASQVVLGPHLAHLVGAYDQSTIAAQVKDFHKEAKNNPSNAGSDLEKIANFRQASWWTQFYILSGRAFKNLYRNPMLMLAHYAVSIVVACESSQKDDANNFLFTLIYVFVSIMQLLVCACHVSIFSDKPAC